MNPLRTSLSEHVFTTQYRVIYGDTDAAGVVYNANYLRYFEIGRTEMMRELGLPYSEVENLGYILPVTESYLRFKASARYDDLITIATSLVEIKTFTCRFHYQISRPPEREGEKQQVLVRGFTVLACIDSKGTLTPFPAEMEAVVQPLIKKNE